MFCGISLPADGNWMFCDASAISRTTYAALFNVMTFTRTANTQNGLTSVTSVSNTADIWVGQSIEGPGIPVGATVATNPSGSSFTISAAAGAGAGAGTIRLLPYGAGNGSTTFNLPDFKGRSPVGQGANDAGQTYNFGLGQKWGVNAQALTIANLPSHDHGSSTSLETVAHTHNATGAANTITRGTGASATGVAASVASSVELANHAHLVTAQGSGTTHENTPPVLGVKLIIRVT